MNITHTHTKSALTVAAILLAGMYCTPSASAAQIGELFFPTTAGARVVEGFGDTWTFATGCDRKYKLHVANDYAVGAGTLVCAAASGVVKYVGYQNGWGYWITVESRDDSGSPWTAVYWHVRSEVKAGQTVSRGQRIGTVYNLGSNSHLHFGVRNAPYSNISNRGALPRTNCGTDPAFPGGFIDPTPLFGSAPTPPPPPTTVSDIVSETSGDCQLEGPSQWWHRVNGLGWDDSMLTTNPTNPSQAPSNIATWIYRAPVTATYTPAPFIARNYATTRSARYEISTPYGSWTSTVDQLSYSDRFVPLGQFTLRQGDTIRVRLTDITGEPYSPRTYIAVDAMRFSSGIQLATVKPKTAPALSPTNPSAPES